MYLNIHLHILYIFFNMYTFLCSHWLTFPILYQKEISVSFYLNIQLYILYLVFNMFAILSSHWLTFPIFASETIKRVLVHTSWLCLLFYKCIHAYSILYIAQDHWHTFYSFSFLFQFISLSGNVDVQSTVRLKQLSGKSAIRKCLHNSLSGGRLRSTVFPVSILNGHPGDRFSRIVQIPLHSQA